jgi:hypothetical protein
MTVCDEILRNISAINDKISSMDKRLSTLELHILKKVDLDDFRFDKISSLEQFGAFLKKIEKDADYRQKMVKVE